MSTPIIFPDVELWATGYLRTALASHGYPGMFVSNKRETQATAVQVRRDGGPAGQVLETPRLGVNVYAPTEQAVSDLARTVSALLRAAPDGSPVTRVTQTSGPSPIPDESGPRRYMTFELTVRGADLAPTP
jgi:hypothetical protein